MAPAGQGALWSEVLCCPLCSHIFGTDKPPVNLACGHAICRDCLFALRSPCCPLDQSAVTIRFDDLPVNAALLSILGIDTITDNRRQSEIDKAFSRIESILIKISSYLRRAESERGGSVWSEDLSRPVQRKLIALLCFQLLEDEGRQRALKTARALAERILSELVIFHQNTAHLSSNLWSAVRARGCQFLGPAMQEEVLRLILLTLSEGALIARKTLVMYIVQTLGEDYPQVSKTCVGHVVQLLYRASCFNVMKREGESSLMQLKSEFRDYESLRREHDAQIVQVAIEAGLRVSPDQWSSLLYGDQAHRSHMQSIIDKLQSPQAFGHLIKELLAALHRNNDPESLMSVIGHFERIAAFDPHPNDVPKWAEVLAIFESLGHVIDTHVRFSRKRNEQRSIGSSGISRRFIQNGEVPLNGERSNERKYKTRLCRDLANGRTCPRGSRCTYAHSRDELRNPPGCRRQNDIRIDGLPPVVAPNVVAPVMGGQCPVPNNAVRVISIPPPAANAVVVDPRQNVGAENGGIVPIGMPMLPVVIRGNAVMEPNAAPPAIPVGPPQIQSGNPLTNAAGQPVMVPAVWPSPAPHPANGPAGVMNPGNVPPMIPIPVRATPAAMHFDPNAVHWMPACGNGHLLKDPSGMQYNIPVECVERYWHITEDGRCAVTVTPPGNVDMNRQMSGMHGPLPYYMRSPKNIEAEDEEQLMLRRREIVSRLAALQQKPNGAYSGEESVDDEDLQSHVSYTVANSVLFDDKEVSTAGVLQLPPIPLRYNAAPSSDETISHLGEVAALSTTVLTVCPPCLWTNGAKPATVQSPCAVMQVKDTLSQPVPTPAIQRPHMTPMAAYEAVDPSCIADRLPPVIRPLPATPQDPQNVVSATLDRIVDVRERMNDVEKNGGLGCSVEKQQLKVELNIVSRQIQSLDQQTKQTCLLRELEEVDKKIENLNIHS